MTTISQPTTSLKEITSKTKGIIINLETSDTTVCNWDGFRGIPSTKLTPFYLEDTNETLELTNSIMSEKIRYHINLDELPAPYDPEFKLNTITEETLANIFWIRTSHDREFIVIVPHDWN